jgi:CheY-like chemotaxis protein
MQTTALEHLLVVLVEDDADLADVTQAALQHDGVDVAVAHDGREGLELIDKLHPRVVVTDLIMPVVDGLELMRRLRDRPEPRVPVIAVSAVGARLRAARDLGAAEVLLKPVDPADLLHSVRKAARTQ